jgi:UDPglucose 6-dehydrogenase
MKAAIGFIGQSHLGINYAVATAAKGFSVIAFHPSGDLVRELSSGRFPIEEPGLAELFNGVATRLKYTEDPSDLRNCELVFVSLDIRTDEENRSDTRPLDELIDMAVPHLKPGASLVVLSQVNPGYTRRLKDRLQSHPAAPCIEVLYQVETLIFGRAVERALHPERYMVGTSDPHAPLPETLQEWHSAFGCPVLVMRYESAELAKIAINFFLVSSVSTTNTLAEVCENIGADWQEIAPALRLDARIGQKAYLNPGLGIAGGNLERDLVTVKKLVQGSDADTSLVDAWIRNSKHRKAWISLALTKAIERHGRPIEKARVAVWGLAYKENTHSTKNSAALEFLSSFPQAAKFAYDPVVRLDKDAFPNFVQADSALACCQDADALVIATPWPEFGGYTLEQVCAEMKGRIIIDPFGMLDGRGASELKVDHYRLGVAAG